MKTEQVFSEHPKQAVRKVCLLIKNFPDFVRVPSISQNFKKVKDGSKWTRFITRVDESDGWSAVCRAEKALIDELHLNVDEWEWLLSLNGVRKKTILDGVEY